MKVLISFCDSKIQQEGKKETNMLTIHSGQRRKVSPVTKFSQSLLEQREDIKKTHTQKTQRPLSLFRDVCMYTSPFVRPDVCSQSPRNKIPFAFLTLFLRTRFLPNASSLGYQFRLSHSVRSFPSPLIFFPL